jgi:tetratricopeptide (TPR) repeat protein
MSKKSTHTSNQANIDMQPIATSTHIEPNWIGSFLQGWWPYLVFIAVGLGLYSNTFHHEFAFDDEPLICRNEYVLKGVSGIGDIMTKDAYESYYKSSNRTSNLAGGRFRPLSLVTFAIEQEFIGTLPDGLKENSWDLNQNGIKDPAEDINHNGVVDQKDIMIRGMAMRHVISVLLYILSACMIFLFLKRFIFKEYALLAFITTLLFLVHPLHTEVVANVKSRDEILSLLFMVMTCYWSFLYAETKQLKYILLASVFYFVALLSKEYGVTLLILIPLCFHLYYHELTLKQVLTFMAGLVVTFGIYYSLRSGIVEGTGSHTNEVSELLDNPYLLASDMQMLASKLFLNVKYLLLLIYPLKMSSDYSYNSIPYQSFTDIGPWFGLFILVGSALALMYLIKQKNKVAFPLAFAFLHLILINNIFFNIGATMGERLVYHTSLGTTMLVVYGCYWLFKNKLKINYNWMMALFIPVSIMYSLRTLARNPAWKNNYTLSLSDVQTNSNSVMLNGNAFSLLAEMSEWPCNKKLAVPYLDSAIRYGRKALQIHPRYDLGYKNMGIIMYNKYGADSAEVYWSHLPELAAGDPDLPEISRILGTAFHKRGIKCIEQKDFKQAIFWMGKAFPYMKQNVAICYDLGTAYASLREFSKAREYWMKGLQLAPTDGMLNEALRSLPSE